MSFVTIPFYVSALGAESYGIIGFFFVLQGLFQLLDLGMAPTVSRQIAQWITPADKARARNLVYSLAAIYWWVGGVAAAIMIAFARPISDHWLGASDLAPGDVAVAVAVMGLALGSKWPSSLYIAALVGAERLPTASIISIVAALTANLGGIAVVALVSPTLKAFFLWHGLVGLAQTLAMRRAVWTSLPRGERPRFDRGELRKIWRFSASMTGITAAGVMLSQLDKLLLSRLLSLADFGGYMIATMVSGLLLLIARPMFQTIYPRMSRLFAGGDLVDLNATYHLSTRFLAAIVFPVAMAMIVYAHDFLVLWVGNAGISARTAPILGLLAAGTAVNAVMHIPFALQLACGKVRLALVISVTLAVLIIPLIIILATQYGAIGGASAWFVLHVLYMFGGTWLTHRELLPGEGRKWLFGDVGVPLLTAALFGIGAATLHRFAGEAPMINLLLGSVITGACIVACIGSSSPARRILLSALHGNLHRKALGRLG